MFLEKQTSLEKRISSYAARKLCIKEEVLAFAGFSKDTDNLCRDGTVCDFCGKSLEGWEKADIPIREHEKHSEKCLLFFLHQIKHRILSFNHGYHTLTKNSVEVLAKNGLFMYCLSNRSSDVFCFNCGFFCTLSSPWTHKASLHPVFLAHKEFAPRCERTRKEMKRVSPTERMKERVFYHRLLSNKVDLNALPHYFVDARWSKTIEVTRTPWFNQISQTSQQDISRERINLSQSPNSEVSTSPIVSPTPEGIREAESAEDAGGIESVEDAEGTATNRGEDILRTDTSLDIDNEEVVATEVEDRVFTDGMDNDRLVIDNTPNDLNNLNNLNNLNKKVSNVSNKDEDEDEIEDGVEEKSDISTDLFIDDLLTYVTEEEKKTLPLSELLDVGLKKMIFVAGETINNEIDIIQMEVITYMDVK